MRYIDTSHIIVPPNWLNLARARFPNNYPSLWSYFRQEFEIIVGKKCWYSESVNIGSNNPIDHFRPKSNTVKALTEKYIKLDASFWGQIDARRRPGYQFLEFEFSNYRYSCYIVNTSNKRETHDNTTKGKSNFFPLKHGSPLGTNTVDIVHENICLIDPCNINEPGFLTFNETGYITPHVSLLNTSWDYCRVLVSIEVYHLHYDSFREKRLELWDYCKERIELANAIYIKPQRTLQEDASFLDYIKELRKKINKISEFSAVAIDCIHSYKKTYSWLDTIFPDHILVK